MAPSIASWGIQRSPNAIVLVKPSVICRSLTAVPQNDIPENEDSGGGKPALPL